MKGSRAPTRPRPDPLARLEAENAELRLRLTEATETLEAIRSGEVEALVIEGPAGPQVFTLASAEAASNALRGAMLAQVSDAVLAVDAGGRLTYLNAAAERMYGVPAADVLGQPVDSLYRWRWLEPAEAARAEEALATRGVWRGESLHELRDGRVRRVESGVTRLAPVDGRPAGLLAVNRDITERHDANQRLRDHDRFVGEITAVVPGIVYVHDLREGRNVFINQQCEAVLGYSAGEIRALGPRLLEEMLHPDDRDALRAHFHALAGAAEGATCEVEYRLRRRDGAWRWFLSRDVAYQRVPLGGLRSVLGVATDITARKEAEAELRRTAELLRAVLETTPDVVWAKDLEGRTTLGNQALFDLLGGGEAARVLGADAGALVADPAQAARIRANDAAVLARGALLRVEETLGPPEAERIFDTLKAPLRDGAGRVIGIAGVSRDVTQARRQQGGLALLADLSAAFAPAASVAEIAAATARLLLGHFGAARVSLATVDPDSWALQDVHLLTADGGSAPAGIAPLSRYLSPQALADLARGHPVAVDDLLADARTAAYAAAHAAWGTRALLLAPCLTNGRVAYLLAVARDAPSRWRADDLVLVTEVGARVHLRLERARAEAARAESEERLRQHQEHLERLVEERTGELEASHAQLRLSERLAALGTLAAGLGHDMGNLLMPLRVRLSALGQMPLPAQARGELEAIGTTAEYLRRLAAGLRLLALDPATPAPAEVTEVGAWWTDTEAVLRNCLPRSVSFTVDFDGCGEARVVIGKAALTQAVFNLVQNAGDAIGAGTPGGVTLRIRCEGDDLVLGVTDTGPGMTDEVRRRCLEPFFTTKPRGISTGLGLSLVHGLVRDAGGTVELESAPGAGTTFTLRLPLAPSPGLAAGERLRAAVAVQDARIAAFVTAELRRLRFEVVRDAPDHPADLLVADRPRDPPAGSRLLLLPPGREVRAVRELLRQALQAGS